MKEEIYKKCCRCKKIRDNDLFYKDTRAKDGLFSTCKLCYKKRYEENIEVNREKCRTWRIDNPDKYIKSKIKSDKKYSKTQNGIKVKKALRDRWIQNNPIANKLAKRKWRQENKELVAFHSRRRNARKRGADGSHTLVEWNYLKEKYNYTCLCCGKKEPEIKLTEDHIVPLFVGGSDYIDNIQPLCVSCNAKKGIKIIDFR